MFGLRGEKNKLTMNVEIKKFVFRYDCQRHWKRLTMTDDPDVRYCGCCQKNVFNEKTNKALKETVHFERCVKAQEIDSFLDALPIPTNNSYGDIFELMVADMQHRKT